eukprot:11196354-Lingulodinium_polyedra.AAC.1
MRARALFEVILAKATAATAADDQPNSAASCARRCVGVFPARAVVGNGIAPWKRQEASGALLQLQGHEL